MNGERTVFGWDGDTLAYETNSDSSTHYVYEAGSFVPLAQFVTASVTGIETPVWKPTDRYLPEEDPLQRVPQRTAEARVFYYHCDQIGTPLMMTDDVGDVVWEASYKAWGEARKVIERASKAAGTTPRNPIRFQGQQHDDETGLAYNRYRYYDTTTGRFISHDPIRLAGGLNLYQYAHNPLRWVDPLGLTATTPPDITAADIANKTRTEIRALADQKGLIPVKADATGAPIKWKCPGTGKERLRLDRGHVDPKTGLPYNDPKAAVDHVHGYDSTGKVKVVSPEDGNPHFPTTGE